MNKLSQKDKIMAFLNTGEFVCTNYFYASYIADPRKRLEELRKSGVNMEWRWCQNPKHHHDGQSKEWKLKKDFTQPNLL